MMKIMITIVSLLIFAVVGVIAYFIWSKENYQIKSGDSNFAYSEQSWSTKTQLKATPSSLRFKAFDNGEKKYKAPSTFSDRTSNFK